MSGYGGDPRYAGYQRQPQPWGMYAGAVASPIRGLLETFAPGASDFAAARDSVAYGGQMAGALRSGRWGDAVGPGLLSLAAGLGALPMVPSVVGALKGKPPRYLWHVAGKDYALGDDLRSLRSLLGDESAAADEFARRWPSAENLADVHSGRIFFHNNEQSARAHFRESPSAASLLKVDTTLLPSYVWAFDDLEAPGYWTATEDVPAKAVKKLFAK